MLCQTLKFEYQDRLRQQQMRRELLRARGGLEPAATAYEGCEAHIECQQIREQLAEPDLKELFDAMVETTGEPNENQKLATMLESTPGEVANRKKRLRRRVEMISARRKPASGEGVTQ